MGHHHTHFSHYASHHPVLDISEGLSKTKGKVVPVKVSQANRRNKRMAQGQLRGKHRVRRNLSVNEIEQLMKNFNPSSPRQPRMDDTAFEEDELGLMGDLVTSNDKEEPTKPQKSRNFMEEPVTKGDANNKTASTVSHSPNTIHEDSPTKVDAPIHSSDTGGPQTPTMTEAEETGKSQVETVLEPEAIGKNKKIIENLPDAEENTQPGIAAPVEGVTENILIEVTTEEEPLDETLPEEVPVVVNLVENIKADGEKDTPDEQQPILFPEKLEGDQPDPTPNLLVDENSSEMKGNGTKNKTSKTKKEDSQLPIIFPRASDDPTQPVDGLEAEGGMEVSPPAEIEAQQTTEEPEVTLFEEMVEDTDDAVEEEEEEVKQTSEEEMGHENPVTEDPNDMVEMPDMDYTTNIPDMVDVDDKPETSNQEKINGKDDGKDVAESQVMADKEDMQNQPTREPSSPGETTGTAGSPPQESGLGLVSHILQAIFG